MPLPILPDELEFKDLLPIQALPSLDVVVQTWTDAQIQAWMTGAESIDKVNLERIQHNRKVCDQWANLLKAKGQDPFAKRGGGYQSWFRDLTTKLGCKLSIPRSARDYWTYQTVTFPDGSRQEITRGVCFSPCTLLQCIQGLRRMFGDHAKAKAKEDACTKKCIEIAPSLGIVPENYPTTADFLQAVEKGISWNWVGQCSGSHPWRLAELPSGDRAGLREPWVRRWGR